MAVTGNDAAVVTSPVQFGAEIDIPVGLRIEVERHGQRFLCSVKADTLASAQGRVFAEDKIFLVVTMACREPEKAIDVCSWLKRHGFRRVFLSRYPESVSSEITFIDTDAVSAIARQVKTLKEVEQEYILKVLELNDQNKVAAAKELGISLKTLYNKLNRWEEEAMDETVHTHDLGGEG